MQIVKKTEELKAVLSPLRASGEKTGFVPTMGALHAGHISLISQCVAENDICVVSIFVNPTQFNNPEDLEKYPRYPEHDIAMLEEAGCDIVFMPEVADIYGSEEISGTFEFDFAGLDRVMEGRFRPGHFNGVVQIVSKLFSLVEPDKAYFGEKDYQQLAIIRRMVAVMDLPVEIIACPVSREDSGLARSSRNERLTPEQRKIAAGISKVLFECRNFVAVLSPDELKKRVEDEIGRISGLKLEYFEIVNAKTLQAVSDWKQPSVGCIAVFCGDVRLIDNVQCS